MTRSSFSQRALLQIAEDKIQQAIRNGEFSNLPGLGRPFEFDEHAYDPHWWIRRKIQRERLSNLYAPSPKMDSASTEFESSLNQ